MKSKSKSGKGKKSSEPKDHDILVPSQIKGMPYNFKSIKNRLKANAFKGKCFVVNMQLRNGKHRTMLIRARSNYFKFQGGTYVIDDSLAYDNISSKYLMLDYHQDFCLPIKRDIVWRECQDGIEASGMYEIEGSTNPSVLTKILEADIGGGIAKASSIPDFIKQMKMLVILAAVSSTVMLLLFVIKSGMLKQIQGLI